MLSAPAVAADPLFYAAPFIAKYAKRLYEYIGQRLLAPSIERHRASIEAFQAYEPLTFTEHSKETKKNLMLLKKATQASNELLENVRMADGPQAPETFTHKFPTPEQLKTYLEKFSNKHVKTSFEIFYTKISKGLTRKAGIKAGKEAIKSANKHVRHDIAKRARDFAINHGPLVGGLAEGSRDILDHDILDNPDPTMSDSDLEAPDTENFDWTMTEGDIDANLALAAENLDDIPDITDLDIIDLGLDLDLSDFDAAYDMLEDLLEGLLDFGEEAMDSIVPLWWIKRTWSVHRKITEREKKLIDLNLSTEEESKQFGGRERKARVWKKIGVNLAGDAIDLGTFGASKIATTAGGMALKAYLKSEHHEALKKELEAYRDGFKRTHSSGRERLKKHRAFVAKSSGDISREAINDYTRQVKESCPDMRRQVTPLARDFANAYIADCSRATSDINARLENHIAGIEKPTLVHRFFRASVQREFKKIANDKNTRYEGLNKSIAKLNPNDPIGVLKFLLNSPVVVAGESQRHSEAFMTAAQSEVDLYRQNSKLWLTRVSTAWVEAIGKSNAHIRSELEKLQTIQRTINGSLSEHTRKIKAHYVRLGVPIEKVLEMRL